MNRFIRKRWLTEMLLVCLCLLLLSILTIGCKSDLYANWYESPTYKTTDLANYEKDTASYGFFPPKIDPRFKNLVYLHTKSSDRCGYETYLEFTLETDEQFDDYVETATKGMYHQLFHFDPSYDEYIVTYENSANDKNNIVCNYIRIGQRADGSLYLDRANVKKIMVKKDERRIIYILLSTMDATSGMDDLDFYIQRFNLDWEACDRYTEQRWGFGDKA